MITISLTKDNAKKKLYEAYAIADSSTPVQCKHEKFVFQIISNTHLTYKYILFTALLSKATDGNINALCLQAGSTLPGAYDARTICHSVIVPFEMEVLGKALGGSNEPFLNKPARFPELNKNNPVRRGNDQALLNLLCDNLPLLDQREAFSCLICFLRYAIAIRKDKEKVLEISIPYSVNQPSTLAKYIFTALQESYEGEVLTLMAAGMYYLMFQDKDYIVEVHPVNQSGASGREISDLDIYQSGILFLANELKDKEYSETDVRHAADKVIEAGGDKLIFIEGPRGGCTLSRKSSLIKEYAKKNFHLVILPAWDFFNSSIALLPNIDCEKFMHFILQKALDTKFKIETIDYLRKLSSTIFLMK